MKSLGKSNRGISITGYNYYITKLSYYNINGSAIIKILVFAKQGQQDSLTRTDSPGAELVYIEIW